MKTIAFVLLIAAVAVATVSGSKTADPACIAMHCSAELAACTADQMCKSSLACVTQCIKDWNNDPTKEKYKGQNCTLTCTYTYDSPAFEKLFTCIVTNNCLQLPPIPNTCKGPNNITIQNEVDPSKLSGSWWIVRGYHQVYDCYPCQRNIFKASSSSSMSYNAMFQVYLENGGLKLLNQNGNIMTNSTPKAGYPIAFSDAGPFTSATYWIIDQVTDYILVYYCGNVLEWNFEGAMVYSATPSLSASAIPAITDSYKKATGLDFTTFCTPVVGSQCPDA